MFWGVLVEVLRLVCECDMCACDTRVCSYPFSENTEEHMTYMTTRCPSWCDRVFLSKTAKTLLAEVRPPSLVTLKVSSIAYGWLSDSELTCVACVGERPAPV